MIDRTLWAVVAYSYDGNGEHEVSFDGYERIYENRATAIVYSANANKLYENQCFNVEPIKESICYAGNVADLIVWEGQEE